MSAARRLELPTWLVAAAIYGGWVALTWHAARLPWWVVVPLGAYLVAWHSSLQHECIHMHPTRIRWVNTLVASPPLGVYLPFLLYREGHLQHHRTGILTDPIDDPESYYVTPETWDELGGLSRARWWIERTLLGRLVLGPITMVVRYLASELVRMLRGDFAHARAWAGHVVLVAALAAYLEWVGFGFLRYLLWIVWPGTGLMMMRSFAEHRPASTNEQRTAIVEAWPPLGLLYLYNNLHVIHHEEAARPWYELPRRWREDREMFSTLNGGYVVRGGYVEIAWRWLVRPKDSPRHPGHT